MQTVSALFESLWRGPHLVESKVNINGVDYFDEDIISLRTSHSLFSESRPQAGCVVVGVCSLEIIAPNVTVPKRASVKPYVRLTNEEKTEISEWVQKGEYYTDKRYIDSNGVLTLQSYDKLMFTERVKYTTTGDQGDYPMTDIEMVNSIASMLDVNVDSRTVALMTAAYEVGYPGYGDAGYTLREILGYIGAMYAGNWCISDIGELRLIPLYELPAETFYIVTENGDPITFGGDRIIWNG